MNLIVQNWLDNRKFQDRSTPGHEVYISVANYNKRVVDGETISDTDIVRVSKRTLNDEDGNPTSDFFCELGISHHTSGLLNGNTDFHKTYPQNVEPTLAEISILIRTLEIKLYEDVALAR